MHYECIRMLKNNDFLSRRVKFIGLREDIPELLASSKALIWPATQSIFL